MTWKRRLLLLGFVGIVLAGLVVYETGMFRERFGPEHPPEGGTTETESAAGAGRMEVVSRPVALRRRAVGNVVPRSPLLVSARVMAAILEIDARVGQRVEVGATLAVLDDRDLAARVSAALALASAAEAKAKAAEAETARARSEKTRAASERERMERLVDRGAATARELEVAIAADDSASAGMEAAAATAVAATSAVEVAKHELEAARVASSHARIIAPRAGVVARRFAEPGEIVLPGGPIVELYDPSDLRLEAAVPEADAARLRVGGEVHVLVASADLDLIATIDEIVPAADPTTRSVLVKVALPPTETLREGVRGTLVYGAGAREVLAVPVAAVRRWGQVESVRVLLPSGDEIRRHVRTGEVFDDGYTEVLTGLAPGETIVVPAGEEGR